MRFFKFLNKDHKRIYLDFSSSTPIDFGMLKSVPKISEVFLTANPGALHNEGVKLKNFLEQARSRVAKVLEVQDDEIIFTSGATESDNLAIIGSVKSFLAKGIKQNEILVATSDLEHSAVSECVANIAKSGVQNIILKSENGIVNPKDVIVPQNIKVLIVSVMYVNNEIGTVQPIVEIAKRVRKLRKEYPGVEFVFHTDATQAPEHFSLRVPSLGIDLMTLGSTKLYCHKGVGVLYKKRSIKLEPIMYGGGQEMGLRSGTQPVELIHEFSYALKYAQDAREIQTKRILELQKYFESQIKENFPEIKITGESSLRTPHILHIVVPGFDSELLVIELDARGIAVSARSSCKNEAPQTGQQDVGTIRFSFGRTTNNQELDETIQALKSIFKKYSGN